MLRTGFRERVCVALTLLSLGGMVTLSPRAGATGAIQTTAAPLSVPAGAEASMYSLASEGSSGALLSWLEPSRAGLALRFSSLQRGQWGPALTIVEGRNLFSNWADHPSIAAQPDGTLVAQWPVINDGPQPPGSYNNSMRIAMSRDRGKTWKQVFADGLDNTHSYTGFVSLLPTSAGVRAVYLSPPRPISHDPMDHRMTLSHVAVDGTGAHVSNGVVDGDTCSCCPTAIGMTAAGPIAAYRDHELGEIRDIAVVRHVNGAWTPPRPVHRDGWKINGCPTNGPAIGTSGSRVAVAWFTAANDTAKLKVAFSSDSGATFAAPLELDGPQATGRPAALMLDDGSAVVAWLASLGKGKGELRVRRVSPGGLDGPIVVAGPASPGRLSGMPQIVQVKDSLIVAWRGDRLQTVRIPIPPSPQRRSAGPFRPNAVAGH
jgi:hypothetical protein